MEYKKPAVIFPGIGYHNDKPLLYYAAKLAKQYGFTPVPVTYHDMPQKIRGNAEMMRTAAEIAFQQTEAQLQQIDWSACERILLIGKSIGTIACAKYAADHHLPAAQIWYTPLEATFSFSQTDSCIAFLGDADPWSDVPSVKDAAARKQIPLHVYPACNHSLESDDVMQNLAVLRDVMEKTEQFIR